MDHSRYETNRQVKVVLTQHGVNLSIVDYSCIGGTVYLTGIVQKVTGDEFTPLGINELAMDISRLHSVRNIQFDLDNWSLTRGWGSSSGEIKHRKFRPEPLSLTIPPEQGAVSTDATFEIKREENISDVLKDINKKKKEDG